MEEKILFTEEQRFRQWWLWLLIIGLNGFISYKIFIQKDFGNSSKTTGIMIMLLVVSILVFFFTIKLKTIIYSDSIEIKFFPFGIHKVYKFQDIQKMEVIKYNPLLDYGGWGIRLGAYNVAGNMGLKIQYKDKNKYESKIVIGTQKPEELSKIIKSIHND